MILPQEADIGRWETTNINWEEVVNNIKTRPTLASHCAAPSTFGFKQTLGCSNLRGSSLTSGDLRCSFAPAHRYQMISSSTSNLLTLIPCSQSTPPSLVPFPAAILPHPPSSSPPSLCLLRFAWVSFEMSAGAWWWWWRLGGGADRLEQSHPTEGCACMCVQCDIYPDQKRLKEV